MVQFSVMSVVKIGVEVRVRTLPCTDEEDMWCVAEDEMADLHRALIPGYEYKGFTVNEVTTFKDPEYLPNNVVAVLVPTGIQAQLTLVREG